MQNTFWDSWAEILWRMNALNREEIKMEKRANAKREKVGHQQVTIDDDAICACGTDGTYQVSVRCNENRKMKTLITIILMNIE